MQLLTNYSNRDKRLTRTEQLEFLDYFKSSLENGFSINSSIELMAVLWPQKQALMLKLDQKMKQGADLGQQLFELGFSKTTVTQIKLALKQGNLIECLSQLVILNRLKNEQIKKIKSELSYPFILAGMMICLLLFMQSFVSSQFSQQHEYTGDILLFGLIGLIIVAIYYLTKILNLLNQQDYQSMKKLSRYFLIGKLVKTYVNYLLVYDIGLLLASGFSLQRMCEYAASQEEGSLQQYLGQKISEQLKQGINLEKIIKDEYFLPDTLLLLLKAGNQRENLSKRCLVLGRSLFYELTFKIEKLVVSIQPVCFILLGLSVLGMYLKLLLPMYSMMQGI